MSSIVWRKKFVITSAVFIRYETDKNFDEFWHWLIYTSYKCINVAWHLQVITRVNNVDKCSFILERTLIWMFIHTRENPYMNVSTPWAGENSKYTEGKKLSNNFGDSQLRRNGIFNFIISNFNVYKYDKINWQWLVGISHNITSDFKSPC